MNPTRSGWAGPCPVCGRPTGDLGVAPCPQCGLPAAAQAGYVVARIGTTLAELSRDRDALLATLRASAPGSVIPQPMSAPPMTAPPMSGPPMAAPPMARPPMAAPPMAGPPQQAPVGPWWPPAGPPVAPPPPPRPRRRLSPQQVLVGLGAVLVVAAALAFVAVAWTRLGVAFQAGLLLVVTAALCGASAWTARRGLRATEEALAAAGAALLSLDLVAARWLDLFGLQQVALRWWWAACCAVVIVVTGGLARGTRSTAVWPLAVLLAAQPLPFLLLSGELLAGPAGVAVALGVAAGDVVAARYLRRGVAPVALVLAGVVGGVGVLGGLATAYADDEVKSWVATAVLTVGGATALLLHRWYRAGRSARFAELVPGVAAAIVGLALAGSLRTVGAPGWWLAAGLGLLLLTAGVFAAPRTSPTAGLVAAGAALVAVPVLDLADRYRPGELAAIALGSTVPAMLAALRVPLLRPPATGAAILAPLLAVLLAREAEVLPTVVAGLLLALLAALAFGVATLRAGRPEEWVAAGAAAAGGLAAGLTTADVEAWGQVGIQLGIVGVAAGSYAVTARRRWVAALAVADLVLATWIAVAGAGAETPEAYTLPAAAGLLLLALPNLRAGAQSWAAEGAAVGAALVPSALVVVADPTALRLALVVAAATALTAAGVLLHRQAPFVLGAGVLLLVAVGRFTPYAPLLPRWLTLGTAGLLLLVLGATYERRRHQAREAVAWVGQMR